MLFFIIPLKSQQVDNSWESTCKLFAKTVRSVCNQTTSDFRAIAVCHEKPENAFTHPNLSYLEVDFPIPGSAYKAKEKDRQGKVLTGINQARNQGATKIMLVDADDCVSKRLAAYVNQFPEQNGWYINQGYIYYQASKFIRLQKKGFHRYCGTSVIIKADFYDFANNFDNWSELVEYAYNNYRHADLSRTLAKQGVTLEYIPFPGAVYVQHNSNLLGVKQKSKATTFKSKLSRFKSLLDNRPLLKKIREEFSLEEIRE